MMKYKFLYKKIIMKKKYILSAFFVIFILLLLLTSTATKKKVFRLLPDKIENVISYKVKILFNNSPIKLKLFTKLLFTNSSTRKAQGLPVSTEVFNNDYNVKFLPETQTIDLRLIKKNYNSLSNNKESIKKDIYYNSNSERIRSIGLFNGRILMAYGKNKFAYSQINLNKIISKDELVFKEIKSNFISGKILDLSISDKKIFISYVVKKNNCSYLNVFFARINFETLNFQPLLESNECSKQNMYGGRIKKYNHNGREGILITTSEVKMNEPNNNAQNDQSIIGKILFIDTISKEVINYSKGHRNPQGLYVDGELILSTEHGPQGGDEINNISFGGNYGWPHASYGLRYNKIRNGENNIDANKDLKFNKSHTEMSFIEPIYSFIPSIGISEIIKIPSDFSKEWKDNFFVTSLNDKSLYRIKFSKDFSRVIYSEKIYIGQRIRDIKFDFENKFFLLLLEDANKPVFGFLFNEIEYDSIHQRFHLDLKQSDK